MKDLIRKRWFVFLFGIVVAVVGLLLFGLILYCIGYRIVYPRQFETSWDAVSGFAAWFGVGVSILSASASFFAIWFAVRVADKQNKIALFEKRYNCYLIIYNLLLCSDSLKKSNSNREVYKSLAYYFGKISDRKIFTALDLVLASVQIQYGIESGEFLFHNYDVNCLKEIADKGGSLGLETDKYNKEDSLKELSENAVTLKNEYCKLCDDFKDSCFKPIKAELNLI